MVEKAYTKGYLKEEKVNQYMSTFKNKPDQIIHRLELEAIKNIIAKYRPSGKYLDAACGFGRIACFTAQFFDHSFAVDASPHMIKHIRKNCPNVKSMQMDVEKLKFKSGTFDFVTAFRFVMNFESGIREKIFGEIDRVMKPGGIFVCNIHLNKWSPRGISGQLRNKYQKIGQPLMSYNEAKSELESAGFKILEVKGIKVLPFYKNRVFINPGSLVPVEGVLGSVPLLKLLADGYIFVCEKRA